MSRRLDPSWLVFRSIENFERDRCVDLFSRPDRSFGFEEFRRDAEDSGGWTAIRYFSAARYPDEAAAQAAARQAVPWFENLFRTV